MANFTLATSERFRTRDGQRQERTEWHTIVAFGKQAEFCRDYLRKGKLMLVEGKLQTREWTDNNNVKRYRTEIVAREFHFVGPRSDDDPAPPAGGGGGGGGRGGGHRSGPSDGERRGSGGKNHGGGSEENNYIEDDIPF